MKVTYGRIAYVSETPLDMLDSIQQSPVSVSIIGDRMLIVTKEAIEEFFNNYKSYTDHQQALYKNLMEFLQKSFDLIQEQDPDKNVPIGDILFTD